MNFLLAPGQNVPENRECAPINPDFPNCTESTVAVANVQSWKTVEPNSGKNVVPGQTVRYTLHFHNAGGAPGEVEIADDITQAIDDAAVLTQPVSTGNLNATPFDFTNRSMISGSLSAGETATVTYEMKVRTEDQLGDRTLANFLVVSVAQPPTHPDCTDTSARPSCTSNPVVVEAAPPGKLAVTGANIVWSGLIAVVFVTGASLLYFMRQNRGRSPLAVEERKGLLG
ncbi:DUF11 domain-containing protein [Leucobacter coleopterorum]|uniref:DUF11 domain-containing protein n=1 Tax=Leucobacter coleopterorum TaxID=2714933 RepID=A0ABX6JUC3_9MICO|nr:DUF11 domain-containing protein [Leucobacter coleopterorum]